MKELKPSEVIPPPYGQLFTMYNSFNSMQTTLMNDLLYTDKSIALTAPTGAGKTVVFELAIVRMLLQAKNNPDSSDNDEILPKAIYIAPIKALCSEVFDNWKARFQTIGITCTQITGDTQVANLVAIRQSQIVVSTPEKWDSLTRRWREYKQLLLSVQLLIIDEVHLLNEDLRGPIIEAIVARMKSSGTKRFIVASATVPNGVDLASWIGSGNSNVQQYAFNEMERPVPLEKHVVGINTKLKGFQFDMKLNYQLPNILYKFSEGKGTLVFCSCRKSAEMAAFNLNKTTSIFQLTNRQKLFLSQLAQRLLDTKLRKLVENGIAYHHAGLSYADRSLIESTFREGFLMVLLCTSTLAMGINLPAHLVIIKSTETYMPGGYAEYPESMVLQMIGRAGRPQYDTKGVAVVLTQSNKVQRYQAIMNGKAPVESHLHKHLTEHLNSEIALGSINNLEDAMKWIRSTYLYVRSVRNPTHYGFSDSLSKDFIEHNLEELCLKQIHALEDAGLVTINKGKGIDIKPNAIGKLMAKYYLCFDTIKLFQRIKGNETLQNIFDLIVHCKELSEFTLRVNEKRILNALNKVPIRFPVNGRIKKHEDKISCILQAVMGNLEITAPGLLQESLKMLRIGERVSKCLLEYVRICVRNDLHCNKENGWYNTMLNAIIISKCFHAKLWENSEYASKQLNGIGAIYSTLLHKAGKTTLKAIAETEARTLERILNKAAPFGDTLLQNLHTFPQYEIILNRKSTDLVEVCAKQRNHSFVHKNGSIAVLVVGDSMNNLLHLAENVNEVISEYGSFEKTIKIKNPSTVEYIYGHILHTTLVGVDKMYTLEINAPTPTVAEKPQTKAKKQTLLNVSLSETLNDSILKPTKGLNAELDVTNDSKITKRPVDSILKQFQFTKPKICHENVEKNDLVDIIAKESNNSVKEVSIIRLNETNSFMDKTTTTNMSVCSRTVQRKLTEYFVKRKKTDLIAENSTTVEFTDQHDKEECSPITQKLQATGYPHMEHTKIQRSSNFEENKSENIEFKNCEPIQCIDKKVNIDKTDCIQKRKAPLTFYESCYPNKKQKHQVDKNLKFAKSSCAMTLSSFLGNLGQRSGSITSLLEKENLRPLQSAETNFAKQQTKKEATEKVEQKHHISVKTSTSQTKNSNMLENEKSSEVLSDLLLLEKKCENISSSVAPLDLSKNFKEKSNLELSEKILKPETDNSIPSDEQLALWYEVAMKFQRIPYEAMSLKNFRHVYNKIVKKKIENQNKNSIQRCINQKLEKSISSHSSSSSNSFRLQLFPNDQNNGTHNTLRPSMVKLINQDVMKHVLNSKCEQNREDITITNFDEVLTDALEDLEKELSH